MVDEGGQAVGPFAMVYGPVAKAAAVIVAFAKPAIVKDEAFGTQCCGPVGDGLQRVEIMVKIDRLPTIVMHRAGAGGIGPLHDLVADMTLHHAAAAIEAGGRVAEQKRRAVEGRAGTQRACCVAPLNLAAPVGQFFGDHPVTAGPTVMHTENGALGVVGPGFGKERIGRMFMPRPPGTRFAQSYAGGPGQGVQVKLARPAARDVNHLVGLLRAGQDRCREPMDANHSIRMQAGMGGDDARRAGAEMETEGQAKGRVGDGEIKAVGQRRPLASAETRGEGGAVPA